MSLLRLVLRTLAENRRRTTLAILSMAGCMFLLCALLTVLGALDQDIDDPEADRILVVRDNFAFTSGVIPLPYLDRLRRLPGVEAVSPWSFVRARLDESGLVGMAVDPAALPQVASAILEGVSPAEQQAFLRTRTGTLMGQELMRRHRWKLGDTVTLKGGSVDADFPLTIVGELRYSLLADNFLMHHDYYRTLGSGAASTNLVFVRTAAAAPDRMAAVIEGAFAGEPSQVAVMTIQGFLSMLVSQVGDVKAFVGFLALLIGLSAVLIVANTIVLGAHERARLMAILRILGYRSWEAAAVVVGEALALSVAAGALGAGLAYLLLHYSGFHLELRSAQSYFVIDARAVLTVVALSSLGGLLTSLPAAASAARTPVVRALRETW